MDINFERKKRSAGDKYLQFICQAHQCKEGNLNGANAHFMSNLMDKEQNNSNVSHLPSAEKQLAKIKEYLIKAFDKFLKKDFTETERNRMLVLRNHVNMAQHSSVLIETIEEALQITQKFK